MKRVWTTVTILWKKWLAMARVIGHVQLRIIFSLFYLVGFSILGILFRFFQNPFAIKSNASNTKTAFVPWNHPKETLVQAKKPF